MRTKRTEVIELPPPLMVNCVCCGERYERGKFKCCAPPHGMASHVWLESYHHGKDGCNKCLNHCTCERALGHPKTPAEEWTSSHDLLMKYLNTGVKRV